MAHSRAAFLPAVCVLLLGANAIPAQAVRGGLDVGALSLRYADTLSVAAASISPDIRVDWERALAEVSGTFSRFTSGGWSAQAAMSGSAFTSAHRSLQGELGAIAGGSTHQDGTRTGQAIGHLRLHVMSVRSGVLAGTGVGGTWDGSEWRRLLLGELGGWVEHGAGTALLTITPVAIDSLRYVDGQLTLSRTVNKVDLSLLAGGRRGSQNPGVDTRTRSWASLNVVAWLMPRLAVAASGGAYPVDPAQGFPGGRFLSVSVRVSTAQKRARMKTISGVIPVVEPEAAGLVPVVELFRADRQSDKSVSLLVRAPRAQTVEVSGDFTGWAPVKLRSTRDGWWTVALPLEPGRYEMNVRVDGGAWAVPPGLLLLDDEFGGTVGLLIVD